MAERAMTDKDYNLVSVVYHASQGAETIDRYLSDAEQDGDPEVARFLQDVQKQYVQLAQQGKQLLKQRLQ
jgi:hypothetical protein